MAELLDVVITVSRVEHDDEQQPYAVTTVYRFDFDSDVWYGDKFGTSVIETILAKAAEGGRMVNES